MVNDRLFIGVYATGVSYADRSREHRGDYARVAFLDFWTLTLDVAADCPRELLPLVEADAHGIRARCGEHFDVSASGQAVRLGSGLTALVTRYG